MAVVKVGEVYIRQVMIMKCFWRNAGEVSCAVRYVRIWMAVLRHIFWGCQMLRRERRRTSLIDTFKCTTLMKADLILEVISVMPSQSEYATVFILVKATHLAARPEGVHIVFRIRYYVGIRSNIFERIGEERSSPFPSQPSFSPRRK